MQAAAAALLVSILACGLPAASSPAIFYVRMRGSDSYDCLTVEHPCASVRAAVGKATVGSTINIGAGTFAETAMITLDKNLVLLGAQREATVISSTGRDWVFYIRAAEIRFQDLTVTGIGHTAPGEGIDIFGVSNVVLERVTIRDHANEGISLADGALTVIDCIFQGNRSGLGNAGGLLQISNSTFQLNTGIALYNNGITTVTNTTFTQNGGAAAIQNRAVGSSPGPDPAHGTLTITGSRIINNAGIGLDNLWGRVTIRQTSISDNGGSGLYNENGVLTLQNSLVMHNQGRGVDLENYGESLVSLADITQTAIINNTQSGLYVGNGVARLTNVTVSGNTAGIRLIIGNLTLAYSTVAYNTSWGIQLDHGDANALLQNSIVAVNGAAGQNCLGMGTRSLDPDTINFACSSSYTAAYLGLGSLVEDPDTRIYVIPLQFTSLAKDTASGACPPVDHRGAARPFGPACDVGSYEFRVAGLEYATPDIIEILPSETPTPGVITLLLDKNANCRHGPGSVYPVLTSVLAGQTVELIGRNAQNTWWLSIIPGDYKCWISSGSGEPQGDPNLLPVLPDPPTPVPTTESGTDFDKDGYTSDKDCDDKNGKIHPGAPETPDDKVDSNCNGDDDK